MAIPLYSTITFCTEIAMTVVILTLFYQGYKKNQFSHKLALAAICYEVLFNISYMVYRVFTHPDAARADSLGEIALAIFHGTLSLIMFIALIVFLVLAWKNYKKGINYFKKHRTLTIVFIVFWLLAVLSGIAFYLVEYL
jgi:uncharacterized membrane protein YozB (DUF420 family)